jgi:hypothetical protein
VAYLTGNNQLSDQVLEQAGGLPGLEVVKFSGRSYPPAHLARYHNAGAIGVMNYWVYFNDSPVPDPADLVIFDDAHLAEQPLVGMFGVRIDRRTQRPLYEDLCDLVLAHTDLYPSVRLMREAAATPTTPPELLAFPHWQAVANTAAEHLAERLPPDDARYVWPRIRPYLHACGMLIGSSAIEIRPYLPPTQTLPGYRTATQRLYLSATLGTMDDLQRRLGVGAVVNVLDEPVTAGETGRRLLVLNSSDAQALDPEPMGFVLERAAEAGRVAWLCASHSEADTLQSLLGEQGLSTYRLRGAGEDGVLGRWSADPHGHLVTAGRYDGLDFEGDLCRLVVLPGVPAASTEFERFVMAYLGDATYMRHRVGQRVTQALGRANRRAGDWAVYVGLAPGLGTLLAQSAVQAAIPADIRPTIDEALARLEGGWQRAREDMEQFCSAAPDQLEGRPNQAASTARRRPGRRRPAQTADTAADEVTAITKLWLGDADVAAAAAERAALALTAAGQLEHAAFWRYVQAQARYTLARPGAAGPAINALRAATDSGANTGWFSRLTRVVMELRGQQARVTSDNPWQSWDEWLYTAGPVRILRTLDQGRRGLVGTHDQQAEAIELLGHLAGVAAHRPHGQSVTDVVWNWTSGRTIERRLWEVKTGDPDAVPRDWVDQSIGQVTAEQAQASDARVVGCILTHLEQLKPEAAQAAHDVLAVVHVDAVTALFDLLADRLRDYADGWGNGSAAERGAARDAVEPRVPGGSWLRDLLAPTGGQILRRTDVTRLFNADG